uniref:Uncharacterized protein n=1 Tax=Rhizophora mucronata TaxID=61149 RepID=A0A2P2Q3S7_RHIMU
MSFSTSATMLSPSSSNANPLWAFNCGKSLSIKASMSSRTRQSAQGKLVTLEQSRSTKCDPFVT